MSNKTNDELADLERERQEEIMESNLSLEDKAKALESGLPLDEDKADDNDVLCFECQEDLNIL